MAKSKETELELTSAFSWAEAAAGGAPCELEYETEVAKFIFKLVGSEPMDTISSAATRSSFLYFLKALSWPLKITAAKPPHGTNTAQLWNSAEIRFVTLFDVHA